MKCANQLFSFQKRDTSSRLPKMLETGIQIFVPLCPDYVTGGIANGVSSLMVSALDAAHEIQSSYPRTSFLFLIADTEEDIFEGFDRQPIEISRNKLTRELEKLSITGKVYLFSESFPNWHIRQYEMEKKIRDALATTPDLDRFLSQNQERRRGMYSRQYGECSMYQTRILQIRHYAQYLVLQDIMREQNQWVLMNYQTETLRTVTKYHPFLPERRKLELIVY